MMRTSLTILFVKEVLNFSFNDRYTKRVVHCVQSHTSVAKPS